MVRNYKRTYQREDIMSLENEKYVARTLFRNVEALRTIGVLISSTEKLAKHGVVWFLHAFRLDVPTGEIIL